MRTTNNELYHAGRKGMKWYQNIFTKEDPEEKFWRKERERREKERKKDRKMIEETRKHQQDRFDEVHRHYNSLEYTNAQPKTKAERDYAEKCANQIFDLIGDIRIEDLFD